MQIDFSFAAAKFQLVLLIYNVFIRLYALGISLFSLWSPKAKEWIRGRKNWFDTLAAKIGPEDRVIWIHCASAGEFEQAKPIIEELNHSYPTHRILVSFFSPSGYQAAKKYPHADIITYLPLDTRKNARRFVEVVHPGLVIFVKYEYWFHHLSALAFHHVPLILVSAIFRKDQLFFRWYGKFYRQILFFYRQIFVQDEPSLQLLNSCAVDHAVVSGDTRFDRVTKIAGRFSEIPLLSEFVGEEKAIVAGSTWPGDEAILSDYVSTRSIKIIIAPHEIKREHIGSLQKAFPGCVLYSEAEHLLAHHKNIPAASVWSSINDQQQKDLRRNLQAAKTLIIDSMGLLSRLYHYATITYVGGGFGSGIHNTLEAVVYGKPVLFGPKYKKFKEARDLVAAGAAFSISSGEELKTKMDHLLDDPEQLAKAGRAALDYVYENTGATEKIIRYIQENRLLTR